MQRFCSTNCAVMKTSSICGRVVCIHLHEPVFIDLERRKNPFYANECHCNNHRVTVKLPAVGERPVLEYHQHNMLCEVDIETKLITAANGATGSYNPLWSESLRVFQRT